VVEWSPFGLRLFILEGAGSLAIAYVVLFVSLRTFGPIVIIFAYFKARNIRS
jgi:hypothetical protein